MRSLLRVELTRLRWRRAVVLLLLGCAVVPALTAWGVLWGTRPVSAEELAAVRAGAAQEIERCERRPREYGVRPAAAEARCEELVVSWRTGRERLSLARERVDTGPAVVGALAVLLMLVGTTFAGHDWNSGSMSNQLLFRPRRGQVWAAKALAVTGVSFLVATAVGTAYWTALWATARSRDLPMRDGALVDSLVFGLRGAALAAGAALGCYALTMLLRSTVATLGVLLGVGVAGGILMAAIGVSGAWQPHRNAVAVITNGTTYHVEVPERCWQRPQAPAEGSLCDPVRELPLWQGTAYLGGLTMAVGAASVLSFRRRDVP